MIDSAMAIDLAKQYVAEEIQASLTEEIILTSIREFPEVWVVHYDTKSFLETGSISHMLVGGGPVIIRKSDGAINMALSASPVEHQVAGREIASTELL